MNNCIFCKLVNKEIPANIVYEDADTIAFLDVKPSAPGHTMVISKKHGASVLDYSQEELGLVMATVQKITKSIEEALVTNSITIGINHKEEEGVKHLHVHLIPRWKNDGGHALQGIVHNETKESISSIQEKIISQLSK